MAIYYSDGGNSSSGRVVQVAQDISYSEEKYLNALSKVNDE